MTAQEAYQRIRAYFSKPGAQLAYTYDEYGVKHCKYRTEDGRKCAVGCLIPDSLYEPEMENLSVQALGRQQGTKVRQLQHVAELKELVNGDTPQGQAKLAFLEEAQQAHDDAASVSQFLSRLDVVAQAASLTVAD